MKEKKKADKVIEALRKLQADSIVLYMKIHRFHWNVRGLDFPQAHKAFKEIYENFAGIFDDLRARLQLNGTPIAVTLQLKRSILPRKAKLLSHRKREEKKMLKSTNTLSPRILKISASY